MMLRLVLAAAIAGSGIVGSGLMAGEARATVLSNVSNTALSATIPTAISFAGSDARISFFSASTGFGPGTSVRTAGSGKITTVFGSVSDFEAGSTIDGTGLYGFAAYPTATVIPFSAADDFVGFSFTLGDGVHYGYAEVAGPTLVGYGYETAANTTILTGAMGGAAAAPVVGTAVPEPATGALMLTALAGLGLRRRRG